MTVESDIEHPFFVFDSGWRSASPERTLARYRLPCTQLKVGDSCISLTKIGEEEEEEEEEEEGRREGGLKI